MAYFCDSHVHSEFSFDAARDGSASVDSLCLAAIDAGLDELAITDHYDARGIADGIYEDYDAKGAFDAIMSAREKYSGKLRLTYGIELGDAAMAPEQANMIISEYPFDFILGSLHALKDVPDFYFFKYEMMSDRHIEQLFERSISGLSDMVEFEGINSVAHLNYMYRYVKLAGKELDFNKYTDLIAEFYRKIIGKGIALEINTSTLRSGLGFTLPSYELIKLYFECGGELITCGSDAHKAEHVGSGIADIYEFLRSAGLRFVTVFHNRKPVMKKL